MRRFGIAATTGLVAATLAVAPALAADLPQVRVKVIGNYSTVQHVAKVEQEFWNEIVPEMSNNMVSASYNHQDVMGIKDFQVLRAHQARSHRLRRQRHQQDGGRRPHL